MTPDERAEAHQKQAELERAEAERRAAEAAAREAEARQRAEELAKARREADYGHRVQCVLRRAKAYFGGDWRSIQPLPLDLPTGIELEVQLSESTDDVLRYNGKGYASFDGQTVQICEQPAEQRGDANNCARLIGTLKDFKRGVSGKITSRNFLRGHIRCDLVPRSRSNGDVIINN